jgi:hypothetical protein
MSTAAAYLTATSPISKASRRSAQEYAGKGDQDRGNRQLHAAASPVDARRRPSARGPIAAITSPGKSSTRSGFDHVENFQ